MSELALRLAELEKAGALSELGLAEGAAKGQPLERWEALGRYLGRVSNASRWILGDWRNQGEAEFGEDVFAQIVEATGLSYKTIANYGSVCRSFPLSRRRAELTFSHHEAVATRKLDAVVADALLDQAAAEEWPVETLREERVKALGGEPEKSPAQEIREAATTVWHASKRIVGGGFSVPEEPMMALAGALGEDS